VSEQSTARHFRPPWSLEELDACFVGKDWRERPADARTTNN
jgi:hypothetical protein